MKWKIQCNIVQLNAIGSLKLLFTFCKPEKHKELLQIRRIVQKMTIDTAKKKDELCGLEDENLFKRKSVSHFCYFRNFYFTQELIDISFKSRIYLIFKSCSKRNRSYNTAIFATVVWCRVARCGGRIAGLQ